ncbi:protein LYRIC-like isoform X2 [Scyliorhinus canicula]|uniref:protein LYRIC-like isoform X2 n=1 Tax=Scyliorhinus canicula TaxID=7830 RepID=UPI0018F2FC8E|nr:protein LYRIC-like isoform X2 [Scyliorhinus canicula]
MLEPLARWLQVLLLRGSDLLLGGGLSDPALAFLPAIALSLLLGVLVLLAVVVVFVRGRGHAASVAASKALPIEEHLLLEESATTWQKPRQHEEPKRKRRKEKAKVPVNGHPPLSNDIQLIPGEETKGSLATEKKALKAKKKKQRSDEKSKEQSVSGSKEKNDEEAGDWVMKISNREKRQLRKERQKKKCDMPGFLDPSFPLYSDGSKTTSRTAKDNRGSDDQEETMAWNAPPDSLGDTVCSWNEATDKASTWQFTMGGDASPVSWGPADRPMATTGWGVTAKDLSSSGVDWDTADSAEQDIFANIGTWDNKAGVRNPPVTFGAFPDPPESITQDNISSQDSPSRCYLSASPSSHTIDEAWLGLDDPFAIDLNSDWSPPTEEWGNWTGDETLTTQEVGKERLKMHRVALSQWNLTGNNLTAGPFQRPWAGFSGPVRSRRKSAMATKSYETAVTGFALARPQFSIAPAPNRWCYEVSDEEEEKSQANSAGSGKSKRKKKKKKGKQTEDSVGSEELRDDSQKKVKMGEDPKGKLLERPGVEPCLTEIAFTEPWNTEASTSSSKNNGFTLDCAKTEKRKMKARRET